MLALIRLARIFTTNRRKLKLQQSIRVFDVKSEIFTLPDGKELSNKAVKERAIKIVLHDDEAKRRNLHLKIVNSKAFFDLLFDSMLSELKCKFIRQLLCVACCRLADWSFRARSSAGNEVESVFLSHSFSIDQSSAAVEEAQASGFPSSSPFREVVMSRES